VRKRKDRDQKDRDQGTGVRDQKSREQGIGGGNQENYRQALQKIPGAFGFSIIILCCPQEPASKGIGRVPFQPCISDP
jgi:hypothetical protein